MTKRKCSARTRSGRPCRAWAVHGSEPPCCPAHYKHGWSTPSPAGEESGSSVDEGEPPLWELMEPVRDADEAALSDEIALNRVLLHRLLLSLQEQDEAPPQEVARIARLVLSGGRAVARLLREERALSGEEADSVATAIDRALDELALEWGVEL